MHMREGPRTRGSATPSRASGETATYTFCGIHAAVLDQIGIQRGESNAFSNAVTFGFLTLTPSGGKKSMISATLALKTRKFFWPAGAGHSSTGGLSLEAQNRDPPSRGT